MISAMQITECTHNELPALMGFIDRHWRKGHILASEQAVLDWYYRTDKGYNFILAQRDGEIFAVLGYIDTDRFYTQKPTQSELWLALWSVRDDSGIPGLGLRLISTLKKLFPQRPVSVLGLSETASKIYKLLGYEVKTLDQLFIYNQHIDSYKLLQGSLPDYHCKPFSGEISIIDDVETLNTDACQILDCRQRGAEYFIQRYLRNPFMNYQLFRIRVEKKIGYAIGRVVTAEGARALRLVDFYGELQLLGQALSWFELHIQDAHIEYMDIYLSSAQTATLQEYGFLNRSNCGADLVVPNYFDPFVAENSYLQCAMEIGGGTVFKADGDQERPNRLV
jgi:hypothetical protein